MDFSGMQAYGDLGAGLGGLAGGLIGDALGANDRAEAERILRLITTEWSSADPYLRVGQEQYVNLGPSAFEGAREQVDPALRDAQLLALQSIMETGLSGGMDAQARARLAQAQEATARSESAARQALQQQAQARGMGTSMTGYATQLANQQGAAQRLGMEGTQAAADANQRALQAFAQGGSLAGQVRGQDYGQVADRARAADVIAAYNARNRQDYNSRQVDRSAQIQQQSFNNRMAQLRGLSAARQAQADNARGRAQRQAELGYTWGSGVGRAAGSIFGGG